MAEHTATDPTNSAEHQRSPIDRSLHQAVSPSHEAAQQAPSDGLALLFQRTAAEGSAGAGDAVSIQWQHARLLGDARLKGPMYAQRRADLFLQLQRTYGNVHVQRVASLLRQQSQDASSEKVSGVSSNPVASFEQGAEQNASQPTARINSAPATATQRSASLPVQREHSQDEDQEKVQRQVAPLALQRHPEGAGIAEAHNAIAQEVQNPPAAEGEGGGATATAPAPATPGGTTTPATPTPGGTTTPATPGSTPTPAPATTRALTLTRAQTILQTAYGSVHTIVPGNIVMLDSAAAILTKYDEVCIAGRVQNTRVSPARLWQTGDAQAMYPRGLNGFAWEGTVYVNRASAIETTTPHEMLHLNTAAGFRAAVGESINEGATQYLTLKALRTASITVAGAIPYQDEVNLATALAGAVTEATLTSAYFGGADTLITAFNTLRGAGKFALLKAKADARDWTGATAIINATPATPAHTP